MVEIKVRLCSGGPHGRTFFRVELSELNSGLIGVFGHFSAKSIDLFNKMAFGKPSNCGVAGHSGDTVDIDCEEKGRVPNSCRSQGRFAACVASANNYHLEILIGTNKILFSKSKFVFHVKHS
jgi:hypothetical protein